MRGGCQAPFLVGQFRPTSRRPMIGVVPTQNRTRDLSLSVREHYTTKPCPLFFVSRTIACSLAMWKLAFLGGNSQARRAYALLQYPGIQESCFHDMIIPHDGPSFMLKHTLLPPDPLREQWLRDGQQLANCCHKTKTSDAHA